MAKPRAPAAAATAAVVYSDSGGCPSAMLACVFTSLENEIYSGSAAAALTIICYCKSEGSRAQRSSLVAADMILESKTLS